MSINKTIFKNTIYNILLLLTNTLYPLITSAYISFIIGPEKIGQLNMGQSFVNWFIIFTNLGLPAYATREVAKNKHNSEKLNKLFSDIMFINFIFVFIGSCVYFLMIYNIPVLKNNFEIYLIYYISLLASLINIEWIYTGLENFKFITIRSIIVKLILILILFSFVKKPDDFLVYGIITVLGTFLNNILNLVGSHRYVKLKLNKDINIIKYIKNSKFFYFQGVVGSVYSVVDQLILGFWLGNISLAFYVRGKQIMSVVLGIILSLVSTLMPRLSFEYNNDKSEYERLVNVSFRLMCFLGFPAMGGIIVLSSNIMYLFGGGAFLPASNSFAIMSGLLMTTSFAVFFNNQITTPSNNEKITLYGNIGVAVVSLVLNFILIPNLGLNGGAISLVIGELVGVIIQLVYIKKYNLYSKFLSMTILKYPCAAIIMILIVIFIKISISGIFIQLIICIIAGIVSYSILIYFCSKIFHDEFNEVEYIINVIKNKNR